MKISNKIIGIVALGLAIVACEKPDLELNDLNLDVTAPQSSTVIGVQFIDETTGEEVTNITPKITGKGAARITNVNFSQNYKVVGGVLDLIVTPNGGNKPTATNPIDFTIEIDENLAGNSAYVSSNLSVSITDEGAQSYRMLLTPNKTSTAGQPGTQVLVFPTITQGARYTTPVDNEGRSMSIKIDTIFPKASLRVQQKKAVVGNRIQHKVNVFKKMTVIRDKSYEFVSEFKVDIGGGNNVSTTVDIILTRAERERFIGLNNVTVTYPPVKTIKIDDVPIIDPSSPELPVGIEIAPPPAFKKAGGNSIAIFESYETQGLFSNSNSPSIGWYNVTPYQNRKVEIIGDTIRITNVRGNNMALAIESSIAPVGELPNWRLYPDEFWESTLIIYKKDDQDYQRPWLYDQKMTVKQYFLKVNQFPNFLTEDDGNDYYIQYAGGAHITFDGTYKLRYDSIWSSSSYLYRAFESNTGSNRNVRTISVEGKCKNGNTVIPNAVVYYRRDGARDYQQLGTLKNGKLSAYYLFNGFKYDFKTTYDGKTYEKSYVFKEEDATFILDIEISDAECAKLKP